MTSGIHSRFRTLKIGTPSAGFPAWAPARTCNYTPFATRYTAPYLMIWVSGASRATVTSDVRRLEERGEAVSKPCRLPPPDRRVVNTYGIVVETACVKARYGVLRTHPKSRHVRYPRSVAQLTFQRTRTEERSANVCGGERGAARSLALDTGVATVTLPGEQAIRIATSPDYPTHPTGGVRMSLMTGPASWKIGENRPQAGDGDRREAREPKLFSRALASRYAISCSTVQMASVLGVSMQHLVFTDVVQKYYAEVDKGVVDEVVALFEVDAEYSRPGYAHMNGREAIRSFYVDDRIIESGVHNIESMVSDSKTVAVEGSFKGTVRGGANAQVKFADFFWAGPNGLIKKRRTYFYAPLV
jgi:ketosteroid isomerase-like protein